MAERRRDERQAERPSSPYIKKGDGSRRTGRAGGRGRLVRRAAAVVALLAIAFCAWSMSQYAQGRDPLAALLPPPSLQTTEAPSDGGPAASQAGNASSQTSFSREDVERAVEGLSYDGEDVSCEADSFRVVLKAGSGIWVEQTSSDSAADMVRRTAERLCALAAWVRDNGVEAPSLTWVTEDERGYVRMVVTGRPDALDVHGSPSDLLAGTDAYAISFDDYQALRSAGGIAQTKGDEPRAPDGSAIPVATDQQEATRQDEGSTAPAGSALGSAPGDQASSGTAAESGGADENPGSGQAASSSAGADSRQGQSPSPVAVQAISVSVDGSAAGGERYARSVPFREGMTAYDALVASGAGVNARDTQFGTYVAAIDGLAEKEHGSMSGWVYAVNGVEPNTACSNYTLQAGDTLTWTYVNVED